MKYSIDTLKAIYNDKSKQLKYLFFWGHKSSNDGTITKSCLSQWWPQPFIVDAITYHTAEHWMMAEKARLFKDQVIEKEIIASKHPHEAKKLGRKVSNFDPQIWDAHKYEIVKQGNYHKFSQHDTLKYFLLNTGNRVLVEASPVDTIWGIGLDQHKANIQNPNTWKGDNLLGFALMEVRDLLLEEYK